jgi:hypothetical protein
MKDRIMALVKGAVARFTKGGEVEEPPIEEPLRSPPANRYLVKTESGREFILYGSSPDAARARVPAFVDSTKLGQIVKEPVGAVVSVEPLENLNDYLGPYKVSGRDAP